MIRDFIKQNAGENISSTIRIIYGGSVKEDNCLEIIHKPDVDGFLIGGASLKPSFKEIIEITNEYVKEFTIQLESQGSLEQPSPQIMQLQKNLSLKAKG